MSILGKIVFFCLFMAIFQKALEVLLVGLALAWIYGFIVKPAETIGFLILLTLAACIRAHPGCSLVAFAAISITALFARSDSV